MNIAYLFEIFNDVIDSINYAKLDIDATLYKKEKTSYIDR